MVNIQTQDFYDSVIRHLSSMGNSKPRVNILDLPVELILDILKHLDLRDLLQSKLVRHRSRPTGSS